MMDRHATRNWQTTKEENYSNDTESIDGVLAEIEILNIVILHLRDSSEDILDMNDVNRTYKNLLKNNERRLQKVLKIVHNWKRSRCHIC